MTIDPTYYIPELEESDFDTDFKSIVKNKLGYQHNREYNDDLATWLDLLVGSAVNRSAVSVDFPPNTAAFAFGLDLRPLYAEIEEDKRLNTAINIDAHKSLVQFQGRIFAEPSLNFATEIGWNPKRDTLPLRGLANYGPYDSISVKSLPNPEIQLSVICPKSEAQMLSDFLGSCNKKTTVTGRQQGEYVVDYNGFDEIFGCRLLVPNRTDANWITIPDISHTDPISGCKEWTRNICDALTTLASMGRSVVLIVSPERWNQFRLTEDDFESFNVHDDVKAFAVRKGIATQFLDQDNLKPYDRPRVLWWLGLAIYTKAMRTPWALQSLDPESAFVGLGYSVDRLASSSGKIVLGCSHLYNAEGQGLQFRLRNIQDPTIRRDRNPYLGFNEARQMGEMIRQLFWESHYRLPDRVVIHKLFPYTTDEIKGIKAGLSGIKAIELLEINHERSVRFLKSQYSKGKFAIDGFPIRRGTVVKLSNDELLLWVHGATDAVQPGRTYFQGKRRIPGPVVIRRYAGKSDVATIVNEVLGLSKMDWNSGDLYSQLPATIKSSQTIARIGRRLVSVGHNSFDYRLFM